MKETYSDNLHGNNCYNNSPHNNSPYNNNSYSYNPHNYQARLNRVLRHIEDNLDQPPSLRQLGKIACFSSYHFHRIFTSIMGESVAAYIRRLLLQRAAMQLSYSKDRITDLALAAGYDSVDAFTRAFRANFGESPSSYRNNGGSLALAAQRSVGMPLFYHQHQGVPPMNVEIKRFPPRLAVATRYIGPYMDCGSAWDRLCSAARSLNVINESSLAVSICYDDPDITPPEKCRMEVCMTLPEGMTEQDPQLKRLLQEKDIYLMNIGSESEYASVLVKGPYSLLHPMYRSLFGEWFPQSGREPENAPGFEVYINCAGQVSPEELLTEILIPLQAKR